MRFLRILFDKTIIFTEIFRSFYGKKFNNPFFVAKFPTRPSVDGILKFRWRYGCPVGAYFCAWEEFAVRN